LHIVGLFCNKLIIDDVDVICYDYNKQAAA
jgi:hypothetical protein